MDYDTLDRLIEAPVQAFSRFWIRLQLRLSQSMGFDPANSLWAIEGTLMMEAGMDCGNLGNPQLKTSTVEDIREIRQAGWRAGR